MLYSQPQPKYAFPKPTLIQRPHTRAGYKYDEEFPKPDIQRSNSCVMDENQVIQQSRFFNGDGYEYLQEFDEKEYMYPVVPPSPYDSFDAQNELLEILSSRTANLKLKSPDFIVPLLIHEDNEMRLLTGDQPLSSPIARSKNPAPLSPVTRKSKARARIGPKLLIPGYDEPSKALSADCNAHPFPFRFRDE